ncbi:MAG: hypothetical protein HQ553_16475 [Chloroflexi bacterium]|nr:hypothetical protein [Chloroflexota bacterium]
MKKASLVLTTINVPDLLYGYADNFEKYGHKDEVEFIVVGDRKTPEEAKEPIRALRARGFQAELLDITMQEQWLKRFPDLNEIIPYNSDNRRNIGYLIAVERGAEIVISIDDDNYAMDDDFLEGHKIVGSVKELKTAHSSNNWFNICTALETDPQRTIYPRGFPYSKRWSDDAHFTVSSGRIMMNAGLWLNDPDVDAVTRLNEPLRVVGVNQDRFMLAPGVYSPINSQNTAFHRDTLPCYYFITMDAVINGSRIDRYGDIWSGFFAVKVIQSMNDCVSVGPPTANHVRNKHDLLDDLQIELGGMILTEELVPIIEAAEISADTYAKTYLNLAKEIEEKVSSDGNFTPDARKYFYQITAAMKIWVDVCKEIMR